MFPRQTVFIVGAGASCELGFPSGDELRDKLVHVLQRDGDHVRFTNRTINRAVMGICTQLARGSDWVPYFETYLEAAQRLRAGLPLAISIDNFLDAHRADAPMVQVGKLAIATVILEQEHSSDLIGTGELVDQVDRTSLTSKKISESWYIPLMRLLASKIPVEDIESIFENVAFIVFNYDRNLEQFLINGLMNYYNVKPSSALKAMSKLAIIHPYGQVGHLPWQEGAKKARYGDLGVDMPSISDDIRTFTESLDDGVIEIVKSLVSAATTLIFMGFGFLPENMNLLEVDTSAVEQIFATTWGISHSDEPVVRRQIGRVVKRSHRYPETLSIADGKPHFDGFIANEKCRALMDNNRFRLAQG
jgi:hypothetical protein